MTDPEFPETILVILKDLTEYFQEESVSHVIVGGIAVNIWGRTRNTSDIDIIIDQKTLKIPHFVRYFEKKGYSISEYDIIQGLKEKSNITIFYKNYRIDMVGLFRKSQKSQIENAKKLKILDLNLSFDSPETLIANKLFFGSLQDLEDALSVYIRNDLDLKKLNEFCSELDVLERLKILDKMSKEELSEDQIEQFLDELDGLI